VAGELERWCGLHVEVVIMADNAPREVVGVEFSVVPAVGDCVRIATLSGSETLRVKARVIPATPSSMHPEHLRTPSVYVEAISPMEFARLLT